MQIIKVANGWIIMPAGTQQARPTKAHYVAADLDALLDLVAELAEKEV